MRSVGEPASLGSMNESDRGSTPGRLDAAAGVVLLGCVYAVEWAVRHLPRTRIESLVGGGRRAGHLAKAGTSALFRLELEALEREDRRAPPSTGSS
jgi:hypothetical protein